MLVVFSFIRSFILSCKKGTYWCRSWCSLARSLVTDLLFDLGVNTLSSMHHQSSSLLSYLPLTTFKTPPSTAIISPFT